MPLHRKVVVSNGMADMAAFNTHVLATFVESLYRGGASIAGVEKYCSYPEMRFLISLVRRAEGRFV